MKLKNIEKKLIELFFVKNYDFMIFREIKKDLFLAIEKIENKIRIVKVDSDYSYYKILELGENMNIPNVIQILENLKL